MKKITISELHEKTGEWVRLAAQHGEIVVTDRGRIIAKIVPLQEAEVPYYARRQMSPAFERLLNSGKLCGGTDSTEIISQDRDR